MHPPPGRTTQISVAPPLRRPVAGVPECNEVGRLGVQGIVSSFELIIKDSATMQVAFVVFFLFSELVRPAKSD